MKHGGFRIAIGVLAAAAAGACGDSPPGRTFYERTIEPILQQKCAGNTSGCHSTNVGDPFAFAAGNFDVTSFESVQKRRDVLTPFGAYPYPLLLIKAVGDKELKLQYGDSFRDIDVQHSGGGILDVGSDAYFTLQTWLENGATANGLQPATPAQVGAGACSTALPADFDPGAARAEPGFATFVASVQPIITDKGCAAGNCHGAPQSDFYITCGDTDDQRAFNFSQAWAFVNDPVEDSQLLRVPLAAATGGRGHTGGDQFASTEDPDYVTVREWAAAVGKLDFAAGNPARQFFADHVQPVLLARGCGFQACHSPQAANDFKLRSGTPGFFSAIALEKNYELLKDEFMAVEYADARRSRAVAKAILENDPRASGPAGIAHRGGPVLETPGTGPAEPASCPGTFDPATSTAFCTLQAWLDRERTQLLTANQVTPMESGDPVELVYVERPAGSAAAGRLELDTFAGGADLRVAATTFGPNQQVQTADAGGASSLLGGCGLGGNPDVQAPDVAHDGTRVAFAARASAADPLGVYVVNIDGSGCRRVTPGAADVGGIKVHNFDPAWSPDGNYLVFASTRGKVGGSPTRSRKRFLPQSDLWRVRMTGLADAGAPEQMTFLSNSEIGPQFMREGRVTMTTEKVSDGFYQLSGRRLNWDLSDYHPLLAQRAESKFANLDMLEETRPSIAYGAATDIREASNGDFLVILSDVGGDGAPALPGAAGALGIFNRSIGPFEAGRVQDGFLPALRIIDGTSASGRAGAATGYRAPFSLPDGTIMAAYASNVSAGNFDVVAIDPRTEQRRSLFTNGGGRVRVDAVLAVKHPPRELYNNRRQLVFGGGPLPDGDTSHSVLHMPDAPMTFTVLLANLRRGRPVEQFREASKLVVYRESLCTPGACAANTNGIYQQREKLGEAALRDDGSVRVRLPAGQGVILELQNDAGAAIATVGEEHQLGPGESVSMGVSEKLFDAVCGGCHGSVSGKELDIAVTPDALTGASASKSATETPTNIGP